MIAAGALDGPAERSIDSSPWHAGAGAVASVIASSATALRLAAGDHAAARAVRDWPALLALMTRERLAVLAWVRAGETVRQHTDARTAAEWRALWASASEHADHALDAYAKAAEALDAEGIHAVLLKGMPLAERLYGEPAVRCSDDVDCFIPASARALAGRVLAEVGWVSVLGEAPGDETYSLVRGGGVLRLEVHSSTVATRLGHLGVPAPESERRSVGRFALRVHAGPLVPAYLAAHVATHFAPPLLWWLDFHGEWSALGESEQGGARRAARAAGLARYLEWAERRAVRLRLVLEGDDDAVRGLGVSAAGRRDRHELWRHVALAPRPAAALRAVAAWVRPPWAARRDGGFVVGSARRLSRHWRVLLPATRPVAEAAPGSRTTSDGARDAGTGAVAAATLDASTLLSAARAITDAGGELVIVLTGWSMAPTMVPGDRLLLGRAAPSVSVGRVVLLELGGLPIVHRVVARSRRDGSLHTRGDACTLADPAVTPHEVVARVIATQRGVTWTALEPTLRFGVAAAARGAWAPVRVAIARLRRTVVAVARRSPERARDRALDRF